MPAGPGVGPLRNPAAGANAHEYTPAGTGAPDHRSFMAVFGRRMAVKKGPEKPSTKWEVRVAGRDERSKGLKVTEPRIAGTPLQ